MIRSSPAPRTAESYCQSSHIGVPLVLGSVEHWGWWVKELVGMVCLHKSANESWSNPGQKSWGTDLPTVHWQSRCQPCSVCTWAMRVPHRPKCGTTSEATAANCAGMTVDDCENSTPSSEVIYGDSFEKSIAWSRTGMWVRTKWCSASDRRLDKILLTSSQATGVAVHQGPEEQLFAAATISRYGKEAPAWWNLQNAPSSQQCVPK